MSSESEKLRTSELPAKEYWHLYSLQGLTPSRFVNVVGDILDGRLALIGPTRAPSEPLSDLQRAAAS